MEITTSIKERLAVLRQEINDHPELFTHLADCYLLTGQPKKAAKTLLEGLEKFPDSVTGWIVKGNLHLKLHQHKQAQAAFKQVLKIDNDIAYAHEKCAESAVSEGNVEWLIYHLKEMARLEPLDEMIQNRLEIEILRRIAIEKGIYSQNEIYEIGAEKLRTSLHEKNLLPKDLSRRNRRNETNDLPMQESDQKTQSISTEEEVKTDTLQILDEEVPSDETGFEESHEEEDKTVHEEEEKTVHDEEDQTVEEELELGAWVDHIDKDDEIWTEKLVDTETETSSINADSSEDLGVHKPKDQDTPDADSEGIIHKSPLMKHLMGKMSEQPASREVHFTREDEDATSAVKDSLATGVFRARTTQPAGKKTQAATPGEKEPSEKEIKRQEEAESKLAQIAKVVTDKEPSKVEDEATDDSAEVPQELLSPSTSKEDGTSIEEQAVESEEPQTCTPSGDEDMHAQHSTRVITKTLAELYSSQGNLMSAIKVYEDLLRRNPDNQTYIEKIAELKAKLGEK